MRGSHVTDVRMSITPHGILAYLPIVVAEWDGESAICADLYWYRGQGVRGLLVLCPDKDLGDEAQAARWPSYCVTDFFQERLLWVSDRPSSGTDGYVMHKEAGPRARWQEVLIRHQPPLHRLARRVTAPDRCFIPANPRGLVFNAPFRFDESRMRRFMVEAGITRVEIHNANVRRSPQLTDSNLPITYHFDAALVIMVGQCRQDWLPRDQSRPAPIWVQVSMRSLWRGVVDEAIMRLLDDPLHDCLEDHISLWPNLRKTFALDTRARDSERLAGAVTLSFSPCPLNPGRTLVMDASFQPSLPRKAHHAHSLCVEDHHSTLSIDVSHGNRVDSSRLHDVRMPSSPLSLT